MLTNEVGIREEPYESIRTQVNFDCYREDAYSSRKGSATLVPAPGCDGRDMLSVLKRAQSLNEECQQLLMLKQNHLLHLIEKCKNKQGILEKSIIGKPSWCSNYCTMFGIPYFKDQTLYPCPPNQDYFEKKRLGYIYNMDLPFIYPWKDDEKLNLEEIIRNCEVKKLIEQNKCRQKDIKMKIKECKSKFKKKALQCDLEECELKVSMIRTRTLAELVGSRRDEYDWLKISIHNLRSMHTADECRSMWFNYLHPEINKKEWTKSEDEHLKALAKKHKYQDWSTVAKELGTSRSSFQCMCRFLAQLNDAVKRCPFSKEEDKMLRNCVKHFQVGNYIPWDKVACYMDGRIKRQIYKHWIYAAKPDIKKGKFTRDEDIMIVAGVHKFGLNFAPIAEYFPSRTVRQICRRFYLLLHMQTRPSHWTTNEDILLLKLVRKYGDNNWHRIGKHFRHRNTLQMRCRYREIQKWLKKNPGGSVPRVRTRRLKRTESLNCMWEDVQKMIVEEKIPHTQIDGEIEVNDQTLHELSSMLLGRASRLDLRYQQFFRYSYVSSKKSTKKLRLPALSRQVEQFLYLLQGKLEWRSVQKLSRRSITISKDDNRILHYLERHKTILAVIKKSVNSVSLQTLNSTSPTLDTEKSRIVEECSNEPEIVEECNNEGKTVEECSNIPEIAEDCSNEQEILEESSRLGVVKECSHEGSIVEECGRIEVVEECSHDPDIVEECSRLEVVVECGNEGDAVEECNKEPVIVEECSRLEVVEECCNEQENVEECSDELQIVEECSLNDAEQQSKHRTVLYLCPPSFTTVVGFRTLLLHCRRLKTSAMNKKQQIRRRLKITAKQRRIRKNDDKDREITNQQFSAKAKQAVRLFKERLVSLFTFPAIMSNKFHKIPQNLFPENGRIPSKIDYETQLIIVPEWGRPEDVKECDESEIVPEWGRPENVEECDEPEIVPEWGRQENVEECDEPEIVPEWGRQENVEECDEPEIVPEWGRLEIVEECDEPEIVPECTKLVDVLEFSDVEIIPGFSSKKEQKKRKRRKNDLSRRENKKRTMSKKNGVRTGRNLQEH